MTLQLKSKESVICDIHLIKNVWEKTIFPNLSSLQIWQAILMQNVRILRKKVDCITQEAAVCYRKLLTHTILNCLLFIYMQAEWECSMYLFTQTFFSHQKTQPPYIINHLHCMLNNTGHGWLVWSKHLTFQNRLTHARKHCQQLPLKIQKLFKRLNYDLFRLTIAVETQSGQKLEANNFVL